MIVARPAHGLKSVDYSAVVLGREGGHRACSRTPVRASGDKSSVSESTGLRDYCDHHSAG